MKLEIRHITSYAYGHPAAEAYGEARLTPPALATQRVLRHSIECNPATRLSSYTDFFGNTVQFFSLPYRHRKLVVTNRALVETHEWPLPEESLALSVEEARQIFSSSMADLFPYLQETEIVTLGQQTLPWVRRLFRGDRSLGDGLMGLNAAIHDEFEYETGSTSISTSLDEVWKTKRGVCQDFAHIGLSILRTAGLPARYVCGYIDSGGSGRAGMVGALATHAWIEVFVPGQKWVALDPTNRKWCGEQYVTVSYGRDSRDATPLRGMFKGSGGQTMKVKVYVMRKDGKQ